MSFSRLAPFAVVPRDGDHMLALLSVSLTHAKFHKRLENLSREVDREDAVRMFGLSLHRALRRNALIVKDDPKARLLMDALADQVERAL